MDNPRLVHVEQQRAAHVNEAVKRSIVRPVVVVRLELEDALVQTQHLDEGAG